LENSIITSHKILIIHYFPDQVCTCILCSVAPNSQSSPSVNEAANNLAVVFLLETFSVHAATWLLFAINTLEECNYDLFAACAGHVSWSCDV